MEFKPPKGTKDLIEEDARNLQKVLDIVRSVFEKFGFSPLLTPAFESFDLLSVKGGLGEGVKDDIYYFKDKSDRELGLRFDLTMPMVRVVATNSQLKKPFKRYAIGRVWRYDQPQSMRYREFWQADVDIVGSSSAVADAECLAVVCECLEKLGFKDFTVRINNRKVLQNIFEKSFEIADDNIIRDIFRSIDKLDKIGEDGVKEELEGKNVDKKTIKKIMKLLKISGTNSGIVKKIRNRYGYVDGLTELEELLKYMKEFKMLKNLKIDLSLVRGLDYYTGSVFEISLGEKVSCGGGGRYDSLIKDVGGPDMPATGISLGISRIVEVMKMADMFKKLNLEKSTVFIANVNEDVAKDAIKIANRLRKKAILCQTDLMGRNLSNQLEYADSIGTDYTIIVGKKELEQGKLTIRDMKKKMEEKMPLTEIMKKIKKSEKKRKQV